MSEESRWYALQAYSGRERKIERLLNDLIEGESGSADADTGVLEVLVPTQEVVEIRGGKRRTVTKRLYPGYILVRLSVTLDGGGRVKLSRHSRNSVTSVQGVIRFVGEGEDPSPLSENEMRRILGIEEKEADSERQEAPFRVGQSVDVVQGPFTDFSGVVQEVQADKGKARVDVTLFGQPTSVLLDFTQLKGL